MSKPIRALRIYIDTSTVGGCLDEEFMEASCKLFELFRSGQATALVSDLLLRELEEAPIKVQEILPSLPQSSIEPVLLDDEAAYLKDRYLAQGVVQTKHSNDALHVAIAVVARADMIVSWNFKHIVHFDKMRGFNAVNLQEGYARLDIFSPLEVV